MKKLIIALTLICLFNQTNANIYLVTPQQQNIQGALNSCLYGDTVYVDTGYYYANIIWPKVSNIKLLSLGDSSNTTIDGYGLGSVIKFYFTLNDTAQIDTNTVIRGFTITNGYYSTTWCEGAGIYLSLSSPKLDGLYITKNSLKGHWVKGAGLYGYYSNPVIYNSSISENSIDSASYAKGAGVNIEAGTAVFKNVKINNNNIHISGYNHGGGLFAVHSNLKLINVEISGNIMGANGTYYHGGGVWIGSTDVKLTNVLIANNIMGENGNFYHGGGIYINNSDTIKRIEFINVTIAENKSLDTNQLFKGGAIYTNVSDSFFIVNSIIHTEENQNPLICAVDTLNITYSNIQGGYPGTGNIDIASGFVSLSDFHLKTNSPCVNIGTLVNAPNYDLDNNLRPLPVLSNPDMGCYEVDQTLGISFIKNQDDAIKCFPNPVNDILFIEFDNSQHYSIASIEIYNGIGTFVKEVDFKSSESNIYVGDLENGLYIIKVITTENKIYTTKVMVLH